MYLTGQRKKCISFFLIGIMVFVTIAGAVISAPVCVYALSLGGLRGTIASLIISLLLQTGVAPTNQTWINNLNSAYGVESSIGTIEDMISNGLLTETANGLVDTGLSQAIQSQSAWTDLGLNEIFQTTVDDAGVIAGSGAVNLANQAIHLGTAGTIGAFAGAAAIGVGIGVLINHVREYVSDYIKYGVPMSYDYILNNNMLGGSLYYRAGRVSTSFQTRTVNFSNNNNIGVVYLDANNRYNYAVYSLTNQTYDKNESTYNSRNQQTENTTQENLTGREGQLIASGWFNSNDGNNYVGVFQSKADAENYVNNIISGNDEKPPVYSPDIVGPLGNQSYDSENDTFPGIHNVVPQDHDMEPVDMTDYQNYIDQANDNTENGDVGEETQGVDFDDFISDYLVDTSNQPIIPDNPSEVPTYPDRPVTPDQPTIPDKPDVTNEDIQQSLEGATTIDLRSVFPFCIPWDIYNLVLIFDTGEDREAPHITFTFPFNENWVVDVDLADYDSVAAILRLLELIVFIVGLMVATRSLIGAKG